jgi:hypothetical protein
MADAFIKTCFARLRLCGDGLLDVTHVRTVRTVRSVRRVSFVFLPFAPLCPP